MGIFGITNKKKNLDDKDFNESIYNKRNLISSAILDLLNSIIQLNNEKLNEFISKKIIWIDILKIKLI